MQAQHGHLHKKGGRLVLYIQNKVNSICCTFAQYFSAFALQCVEKSLELKQLRESSTAFLTTRKVQEFCNRQLVSLESDFGTKMLWRKHFVKKAFHYHCLDLKYVALKRIVTNKYTTLG